ncbi:hypothetical protein HK100_009552 [Physocladia obscura]|uniref:Uncharacterized protein n=1 Tax=Physocladia obscura TaxID=109957 RepID=A0AAD5XJ90_9FUNG|nr:hypothetical protein HK100_009552 [Physocladia obscura]
MSYDYSQILVAGNCYVSSYAIGIPIPDYGYDCALNFYCPNSTSSVVKSLPQLCSPTADCVADRLKSQLCSPQGPYEPELFDLSSTSYARLDFTVQTANPNTYESPTGRNAPISCPALSTCPAQTEVPVNFGGIVICAIVDVILAIIYIATRRLSAARRTEVNNLQLSSPSSTIPIISTILKTVSSAFKRKPIGVDVGDCETGKSNTKGGGTIEALQKSRNPSILPESVLGLTNLKLRKSSTFAVQGNNNKDMAERVNSETQLAGFMSGFRTALDGKEDVFVNFLFEDLGLQLKDGKHILKGVNGEIKSKKLTAIMGPSGCGSM